MGFWGYHMFENDRDQDILCELCEHFDVIRLSAPGSILPGVGLRMAQVTPEEALIIRKVLDKGAFSSKFADQHAAVGEADALGYSRRQLIVLGATAIEFGVSISAAERKHLRDSLNYRLSMYSEAKFDILRALELYENGTPLRLRGLASDMYPRNQDGTAPNYSMGPVMMNIWDPSFLAPQLEIVWNECGGCFATENLKECTRCHLQRFCSRDCQRKVWSKHKLVCRAPATPATT